LTIIGATPQYVPGGRYGVDGAGYRASSAFAELRIHTNADRFFAKDGFATTGFQLFATAGVGVGKLFGSGTGREEEYPIQGRLTHYEQGTVGLRYFFSGAFSMSLEGGLSVWNGLSQGRSPNQPPYDIHVVDPHSPLLGYFILLSAAIRTGPQ
jgi:hypothetical protein